MRGLEREGFRHLHVLRTPEDVARVVVERQPLCNDRRSDHGPFDIIGDVHGCCDELEKLLALLGYDKQAAMDGPFYAHPVRRKAVFVGDLVDRGPRVIDTVMLVRAMVRAGTAFCAGQDLRERVTADGKTTVLGDALEIHYNPLVRKLRAFPFPVEGREVSRRLLNSLTRHLSLVREAVRGDVAV